jgi:parvulin-like peptidyl-prolyl isomerase
MAPSLRSALVVATLVLSGCASEQQADPRVGQLQEELQKERETRDRLVTVERQRATTAEDALVQSEREVARLGQELAASRASTAALQLASDTAMVTVRRQEEELVRLRGTAPVASRTPAGADDEAGDGTPLGAAMALLRARDKELRTLQEELAIARNPDLARQPGTAQGKVRASNLDLEVPVATVDGERITRRDFIEFLYRDLASPALLQLLVNRLLVLREARRRGLEVSDVDVALWVQEQLIEQTGQAGGQEKFVARLAKGGFNCEAWEARLRFQARPVLLVRRMIEQDRQSAAGREAFERRVRERYGKVHSDKVSARHILVAVSEEAPPEEVAVARRKIDALADLLAKGQAFSELARRSSDDRQSKGQGGQLGRFDRARFAELPELNTAFFTLAPGTPSKPIRTPAGFHLVLVDERFPPDKPYDEETRAAMAREVSAEPPSEDEQQGLLDRLHKEAQVTQSLTFE